MKTTHRSNRAQSRGLTLIELVVVLAILVALAGLIIANFPGLLKKASGATAANTIQDIGRAMSIRYTTKGAYPTAYDSLIETDGNTLCSLPAAAKAQVAATAIGTTGDLPALQTLGVTSVCNLIPYPATAPDATWSVATNSNIVTLSTSTKLALVTDTTLWSKLIPNTSGYSGPSTNIYLMGIGKVCTLIGGDSTLLEAPTRTGTSNLDNSDTFYQRYCVAFLVDGPSGSRKARFIGVVAPAASGFEVTDDATKTYQTN